MFLDYKNTRIHYTDQGKGAAVILLHGFLENVSMWDDLAEELSKRNRVVCIDLLGHGASGGLKQAHSMQMMAEVVHFVINRLKLKQIILIGHSMGGYVSLALLEKYASSVKAICLVNSTAVADSENRKKKD